MKQRWRRPVSLALAWVLALSLSTGAWAAVSDERLADTVTDTAAYMYRTVKDPQVGSIGGEWAVLGLARSGYEVPEEYYQKYYATVESYVKACDGVLHDKKYTEYSRLIVALSSIGKDARDVAGYDLTKPLGDYGKTIWQGLNGPIWALIALDSKDYPMPENPEAATQATRQMYIDRILDWPAPGRRMEPVRGHGGGVLGGRGVGPRHHGDGAPGAGKVPGPGGGGKGHRGGPGVHVEAAGRERGLCVLGDDQFGELCTDDRGAVRAGDPAGRQPVREKRKDHAGQSDDLLSARERFPAHGRTGRARTRWPQSRHSMA